MPAATLAMIPHSVSRKDIDVRRFAVARVPKTHRLESLCYTG
ncbi:hypothetical protein SBA4_6330004 [Candidatus Sulfopaludibacter sp. SbA4]|nr:hypothetical protein SBA4_6330004 [Candidatus Sulfopaludibacter sp. SbA4]